MKTQSIPSKNETFSWVALFLQWYLKRATLEKNWKIRRLLEEMDRGEVADAMAWADLLRQRLSKEAFRGLMALLERPLDPDEMIDLFKRIDEYIQMYAIGWRT